MNRLEPLTLEPLNTRSGRCGVRVWVSFPPPLKPKHLTFCLFNWKWIFSHSPGRNTSLPRWQPEKGSLRPSQSVRQCLFNTRQNPRAIYTALTAQHTVVYFPIAVNKKVQQRTFISWPAHVLIRFVSLTTSEHSLRSRIKFWYFALLNYLSLVFQCLSFDKRRRGFLVRGLA